MKKMLFILFTIFVWTSTTLTIEISKVMITVLCIISVVYLIDLDLLEKRLIKK